MMTNHTPGPWKVHDEYGSIGSITNADGSIVVAQAQQVEPRSQAVRVANAHLIASAPDLLLALERITSSYRSLLTRRPVRDVDETLAEVDAAIRKARGET